MFIVPVSGDTITTDGGVKLKVVSYTNYKELGPAVYVERAGGGKADPVYFKDIAEVDGVKVNYVPGGKVLEALGRVKRKYHLPQPGDAITARLDKEPVNLVVKGYKLHRRGELTKGLVFVTEDDVNERLIVRLNQIIDVRSGAGSSLFRRERFLSYYDDYRGTDK